MDVDGNNCEVNLVMAAIMAAIRKLFPPLKIKRKLLTCVILLAIYGWLVNELVLYEHLPHLDWGAESTVLNGLVLGFLISFRNNHAYDRWWEARKLWGQLINESRNLCLKVQSLPELTYADRQAIGRLVTEFGSALAQHLRREASLRQFLAGKSPAPQRAHEPARVAGAIYDNLQRWRRDGQLDGWTVLWLDGQVKSLMDICGSCERIRNTPLSSSYRALLRHGIALYLVVFPFYLIEDTGPVGYPLFVLAAYFLLGIEMVADQIEEPFQPGGDNLPLESYSATIASSVREILGSPERETS